MNSQELRALQEAYSQVYAPQELDEAIYSEKGKAKAAEMISKRSTPSGRAKSGKGANVAQIRQIRGSGRGDFDREGLGGTPMTPTMAKNPIKKQNYTGTGNKAAKRVAALKEDLYDIILSHLLDEGYADTEQAAEAIMVNMSEEWRESIMEADSLAAMAARREKRLKAQRKREGTSATGQDFGHNYGQTAAQREAGNKAEFDAFIKRKK
jgi:hypothetical protein